MPSQVTPTDASEHNDITSSMTAQRIINEGSPSVNSTQEQENVNEQLLKATDEVYGPVLRLMKLFGAYTGTTKLKRLVLPFTGQSKARFYLHSTYCGVLCCGFWFKFVMGFVGVFSGDKVYMYLLLSSWSLLIAFGDTVCLIVLPLTVRKKSRFEQFLRKMTALTSNSDLKKVKLKLRKGIIMCFFFYAVALAFNTISNELLELNVAGGLSPWDQWFGSVIVTTVIDIISCGVWLLQILFFCSTCLILEELFDDLHKRMPSLHSNTIALVTLKTEYHNLCNVVELADKMFAPLLFGMVSVYIPILCFTLYHVTFLPKERVVMTLSNYVFWLLAGSVILAIILYFGSKLNEKIHSLQNFLQTIPVSPEEEGKLVMFMLDLQGDPKGLSIGGLVVITKSMSLTTVGLIASYFVVMLTLPS